ncbi:MAG: LacI family DNA-binding transcriptional regulator [Rhodospirillaceae bacterium]|nr:LacI family DNA-binding transcriptional regulator [Rhodospirillaceae bacterium]
MSRRGGRPHRRVTLRDVAAAASVSPMTVSNYINGKFQFMSEATRRRVQRAAERLGYRPHASARSLRLAERLSIGMIVVDDSPAFLADPFITYVVAGLSNYLGQRGYALVLQGLPLRDLRSSPLVRHVLTDGLCILLSGSDATRRACLKRLAELEQPVVAFQERRPRGVDDLCVVRQDDRHGGALICAHLLERGARRLAVLRPVLDWPAIREREAGMRQTAKDHGARVRLDIVRCGDETLRDTQLALESYLDRHGVPDAVAALNDQMGLAAIKLLRRRGLRVPQDVLVTGFNAFHFWEYADPLLTTVRSPAYEMGARGGEAMLRRLREGRFPARDIVLPVELQPGDST